MKLLLLLISVIAVNCLSDQQSWNDFKIKFSRYFSNKNEEVKRFGIFQQNLRNIEAHNVRYQKGEVTYFMGVNQFTDMTHEEYLNMLRFNKASRPSRPENVTYLRVPKKALADLPDYVDWREKNVVTEVKNQEDCGSCWAFSTTGGLEGQYALKYGNLVSLSEQNLLDCSTDYGNGDCDIGGTMLRGFNYVKDYGINSETVYPYEAVQKTCRYQADQSILHINGYQVIDQNEEALKYAVATYGPVSIAIDFSLAGGYAGGIFNNAACHNDLMDLNHGVLAVGYGTEKGIDYWIVKNSWSANYGEQGYIRMIRNADNQCGVTDDASIPLVI